MHLRNLLLAAAAQFLSVCSAVEHQQFYRWSSPGSELAGHDVYRRQGPLPGYHPEFGTCGSGTTCENACGGNWKLCKASTSLSLFCYNEVDLNQTCCENGSGRACDSGYYCAWNEFGGKTWCCKNGQNLEECGVTTSSSSYRSSSTTSSYSTISDTSSSSFTPSSSSLPPSTSSSSTTISYSPPISCPTPSITTCPSVSVVTTTTTETVIITYSQGSGNEGTTTVTVTTEEPGSVITVSVYSTVSIYVTIPGDTVTVPGGTVTIPGGTVTVTTPGGCSSSLPTSSSSSPTYSPPPQSPSTSTPTPSTSTPCDTTTMPQYPTKPTHHWTHPWGQYTTKTSKLTTEPCTTTDRRYNVEITPGSSASDYMTSSVTPTIVTAGAGINRAGSNRPALYLAMAVLAMVMP